MDVGEFARIERLSDHLVLIPVSIALIFIWLSLVSCHNGGSFHRNGSAVRKADMVKAVAQVSGEGAAGNLLPNDDGRSDAPGGGHEGVAVRSTMRSGEPSGGGGGRVQIQTLPGSQIKLYEMSIAGGTPLMVGESNQPVRWEAKDLPVVYAFDPGFPQDFRAACVRAGDTINRAVGGRLVVFSDTDVPYSSRASRANVISIGKRVSSSDRIDMYQERANAQMSLMQRAGEDAVFFTGSGIDFDGHAKLFSSAGAPNRLDVESYCLHEIGHTFGLRHSDDPGSVMYASYDVSAGPKRLLSEADKSAFRLVYAAVVTAVAHPPLSEPPTGGGAQ